MEDDELTFGHWLRRRRQALHLTREQLSRLAACSVALLRKLEDDERRPSPDVATALAAALLVPNADRRAFVQFARGEASHTPPRLPEAGDTPSTLRPLHAPSNLLAPAT